jgi:hypothetical protein
MTYLKGYKQWTKLSEADEVESTSGTDSATSIGSAWKSCINWKAKGTSYWDGSANKPKITVETSNSGITVEYFGSSSGYSVATPGQEVDTIHQVFNILMCEGNPHLEKNPGLKPDVDNISSNCVLTGGKYSLKITVPFISMGDTKVYQFNRRGGWNHDPGPGKVKEASKGNGYSALTEEPVTHVVKVGGGKITEYFLALVKI